MRLDKYLWAVRLFKTRTLATKACNSGQIRLNQSDVKASHTINNNDIISIKHGAFWREYKVLDFPKSRVGNKLVPSCLIETTAEDVMAQLMEIERINRENRSFGLKGRPTKKVRRDMDRFRD